MIHTSTWIMLGLFRIMQWWAVSYDVVGVVVNRVLCRVKITILLDMTTFPSLKSSSTSLWFSAAQWSSARHPRTFYFFKFCGWMCNVNVIATLYKHDSPKRCNFYGWNGFKFQAKTLNVNKDLICYAALRFENSLPQEAGGKRVVFV